MDCPVAPRLRPPFGRHPPRLSPRTMSLDPRAPTESSLAGSFAVPPLMGFEPSSTRRFSAEVALAGVEPRCVLGSSSPRGRLPNASGGQDRRRNGGSAARRQRGSIAPEHPELRLDRAAGARCSGPLPRGKPRRRGPAEERPPRSPAPSGFFEARSAPPSTSPRRVHSREAAGEPDTLPIGSDRPRSKSRSVLVVSHHLDGFLRDSAGGLVASRCQSWGSPRFPAPPPRRLSARSGFRGSPGRHHPSECSPDPQPVRSHLRPSCPLAVVSRDSSPRKERRCQRSLLRDRPPGASASRLCSANRSVPPSRRCRRPGACPPWAFSIWRPVFLRRRVATSPPRLHEISTERQRSPREATLSVRRRSEPATMPNDNAGPVPTLANEQSTIFVATDRATLFPWGPRRIRVPGIHRAIHRLSTASPGDRRRSDLQRSPGNRLPC